LLIAKLVGPSGLMVGVDRPAEAIDVAEKQATVAGHCYWTRFVTADPDSFVCHERFDAVVARQTLLSPGKPSTVLRLCVCVRPGGAMIIAFSKPAATTI
jgi:ubiquinone/menaquinone biosynthesis C-methylase UbiE